MFIFFINFKYHWFIILLVILFALIINSNNIFVQWILFDTIIRIRLSTIVILKIQRNPRLSTFNYPKRGAIVSLILVKFFLNKDVSKFASNDIRPSSILSVVDAFGFGCTHTHTRLEGGGMQMRLVSRCA